MSASLLVDLFNTVQFETSIAPAQGVGNGASSGQIVGRPVDMLHANTFTNLVVGLGATSGAIGVVQVQVQTSDDTTSGNFTDPTSGLAQIPAGFSSGGIYVITSGALPSGGFLGAGFQRPHRYVRAFVVSGLRDSVLTAGFAGQQRRTGSGGGFTYSPTSGTPTV